MASSQTNCQIVGFKIGLAVSLLALLISNLGIVEVHGFSQNLQQAAHGYINIKVVDADSGKPIQNATVIIWDLARTLNIAGIFFTDPNGEYYFNDTVAGGLYRIYAYKGNLTVGLIEYAPGKAAVDLSFLKTSENVTFRLVPAASVHLIGEIRTAEMPEFSSVFSVYIVKPEHFDEPPLLSGDFISIYDSITRYYLREKDALDKRLVFIPARVPVDLKFVAPIWTRESGLIYQVFRIRNILLNKGEEVTYSLDYYSLGESVNSVRHLITTIDKELDEAQKAGFYFAAERETLRKQSAAAITVQRLLERGDYYQAWKSLSAAYRESLNVRATLGYYVLVSAANAVYLPAFFAVYSVILAFFVFEDSRRKLVSSLVFYALFIALLFQVYPGTKIIVNKDIKLFAAAAGLSIATALGIVFGLPRRWKFRIEGAFRLRDVLAALFSLGKRQIKIRRARGFLALSSLIILVLGFTSLTSFGVLYGITMERLQYISKVDGILMKETADVNQSFFVHGGVNYPLFVQLGLSYYQTVLQDRSVRIVAPKIETYPSANHVGQIISKGKTLLIYGVVGIKPKSEALFTGLEGIITKGRYLEEGDLTKILISGNASNELDLSPGDIVGFAAEGVLLNYTVKGVFSDAGYGQLTEIDGQPFGPKRAVSDEGGLTFRVCDAKEVAIMNIETAIELQRWINDKSNKDPDDLGTFNLLSRIALKTAEGYEIPIVDTIVKSYNKDAYISQGGLVTHYFLGFYYEAKGALELLFPLVMTGLNVGAVMLNAVYERRREMRILTVIGSNPGHLAMLFISEAIILGMVGGGLGYLFGLGFYRIMPLIGTGLMVREKLEWWWSAIGFGLAIIASVLSTLRPALVAVKLYTPSKVRRVKVSEKEKEARKGEIFKVFQERSLSMPIKVSENDAVIFFSFLVGRLEDLSTGIYERIVDIIERRETQTSKGRIEKRIGFIYINTLARQKVELKNEVVCSKDPDEDYYRVYLISNLEGIEVSEDWIYRIAEILSDITLDWTKNRDRIVGSV